MTHRPSPSPGEISALLNDWSVDTAAALDRLIPELYGDLRRLAAHLMARERSDHTLQPTALVHETFLRLRGQRSARWRNRSHFLAIAALQMRRLLRQHARGHAAAKRRPGPDWLARHPQEPATAPPDGAVAGLLADLYRLDPRQARVAALRVLAGLTESEVAQWVGVSRATVQRDWRLAKAWLRRALATAPPSSPRPVAATAASARPSPGSPSADGLERMPA
jgi:RNA polymerase sigma factor (TIGR02999 family)